MVLVFLAVSGNHGYSTVVAAFGQGDLYDPSFRQSGSRFDNGPFSHFEHSFLSPKQITTDFIYVRLHGPDGAYQGSYDEQTLAGWAGAFSTWARNSQAIYCYFDNDQRGYAVQDALRLQAIFSHPDKRSSQLS